MSDALVESSPRGPGAGDSHPQSHFTVGVHQFDKIIMSCMLYNILTDYTKVLFLMLWIIKQKHFTGSQRVGRGSSASGPCNPFSVPLASVREGWLL